jgi:glycosyltransferase involved in cell wall biosynthesis
LTNPKILYIIGQLQQGGAEQQLYYLLKYLQPRATVLSLSQDGYWADPIRKLGYDVIELERKDGLRRITRLCAVVDLISTRCPNIIHIFIDGVSGLYGRLAALITQHTCVIVGGRCHPSLDSAWCALIKRFWLNRYVSAIVANARLSQAYLIAHDKLPPEKVRFIPNGLELDRFIVSKPLDRKSVLPETWHDKIIIGAVCNLYPIKEPETYVRVAKHVLDHYPEARFLHVGDGPLRPVVEGLARDLGVQESICFLGLRHDVPELLRMMDIFVLTSRSEGMPNAAMEAMAADLPCVVTDAGDCKELVCDGETGFVVPTGDEEKLGDRILELLQDEALRRRMGLKGRERVQAFDVHRMVEQYKKLYRQVLSPR